MENHRNLSWWEREVFFENVDVAIIGSGIVGLNAAIRLKELDAKLRVLIIERGGLPAGASTRNAGFACFGSMSELLDDLQTQSEEDVFSLVEMRWRGLQRLKERVGEHQMDYQEHGGYELFREEEETVFQSCMEHMHAFNRLLAPVTGRKQTYHLADEQRSTFGFSGSIKHLIRNEAEGQLQPAKMVDRLSQLAIEKGVRLINGLAITRLETSSTGPILHTGTGWTISPKKVLVANNGFAQMLIPELDVQPARNQVLVTHPIPDLRIKGCFHYDRGYYYFRNIGNRILLGGGRNLAPQKETTADFGFRPEIKTALTRFLQEVLLPGQPVEPQHWWSGIMGLGVQKRPIIEEVHPDVMVAVRLGGMGVAIGSLVGEEAAGQMLGMPGSIIQRKFNSDV